MNYSKLVRYNLARPIDQRLSVTWVNNHINAYKIWLQNKRMLEEIITEIDPKIQELRKTEALMASIGVTAIYRDEKKESKMDQIGSGGLEIYSFGDSRQPSDLSAENDSFHEFRQIGENKGERERNIEENREHQRMAA